MRAKWYIIIHLTHNIYFPGNECCQVFLYVEQSYLRCVALKGTFTADINGNYSHFSEVISN